MPASRSARRGSWFPALVHTLAVTNLIVCALQIITDIVYFWLIYRDTSHIDKDGSLDSSALSGVILLLIHLVVIAAQIYFGVCLLESVKQRDFIGCRQWLLSAMNIYGIEFACFLFFAFLAPRAEFFVVLTTISIMYKCIQLWPVDGFILNLEIYSEPLLGEEEFHM